MEISKSLKKKPVISAVVLGAIAALLSAGIWFLIVITTKLQIGIIAIIVGVAVGEAVSFSISKNIKSLKVFELLSVVFTVIGMTIGEYLINWHYANKYFIEEGLGELYLIQPITLMLEVVRDSLFGDPLTFVFWGIAIWAAYVIPKKRLVTAMASN